MANVVPFRCGFVAVIGRPNVGKSTLINVLVGTKVSIVTPKPQTTRHRILGVQTTTDYQVIYVDTPGLHRESRKAMNRMMNRTAANALSDADLCMFVCEANRWTREDQSALDKVRSAGLPTVAVLNKTDKVHPKEVLLETIAEMSARHEFREVIPLSAKTGENLDRLKTVIPGYLPESAALFPAESKTDRDETFRIAEIVREKLTLSLRQEVPYGLTVQVERMERDESVGAIVSYSERFALAVGRTVQQALGRPINPIVYPADELRSKLEGGHHFLTAVLADKKIFVIGTQDELGKLLA